MIVGGVILCATGIGAPLGAGLIVGGVVGFVAQYFQEEIGGFFNSVLGADGTQAMGGGFSVVMGGVTINIGTKLIGKGGAWGTAAAVVCFVIGAALMVFGANELVDVAFDFNIIKELTNISDSAYNNLYRALNYAATVVVVAYSTLTKYYAQLNGKDKLANARKLGKEGEALAREKGLGSKRVTYKNAEGKLRISDGSKGQALQEVKNVAKQGYTKQIKDYVNQLGKVCNDGSIYKTFELYVRRSTILSASLKEQIALGRITIKYL